MAGEAGVGSVVATGTATGGVALWGLRLDGSLAPGPVSEPFPVDLTSVGTGVTAPGPPRTPATLSCLACGVEDTGGRPVVAAGSTHGRIYFWRPGGRPLPDPTTAPPPPDHVTGQHGGAVTCLCFGAVGPSGVLALVSGGDDGMVLVWDLGTGSQLAKAAQHPGPVASVVFADLEAVGRVLLSSGRNDPTLRVWDVVAPPPTWTGRGCDGAEGTPRSLDAYGLRLEGAQGLTHNHLLLLTTAKCSDAAELIGQQVSAGPVGSEASVAGTPLTTPAGFEVGCGPSAALPAAPSTAPTAALTPAPPPAVPSGSSTPSSTTSGSGAPNLLTALLSGVFGGGAGRGLKVGSCMPRRIRRRGGSGACASAEGFNKWGDWGVRGVAGVGGLVALVSFL
jgi:hypothetical protein